MIDHDMIACWKINYGLDTRTPADAMRYWDERCNGMAPAGAVAALGLCIEHIERLETDRIAMRHELEIERARLAACGVVAMSNTPESAAVARQLQPDYRSASCDDVATAVDREMSLRAERDALRAAASYFAHCPQCASAETCADGCTFALDAPNDHQHMLLLRSALRE